MGKIPPPGWTTPEKGAGGFDLTELINGGLFFSFLFFYDHSINVPDITNLNAR